MMAASFRQAFSVLPHNRLASWPTFCVPQTDGCQLLWSPKAKNPALGQNGYLVDVRELASDLAGSAHVMVHRLGRDL